MNYTMQSIRRCTCLIISIMISSGIIAMPRHPLRIWSIMQRNLSRNLNIRRTDRLQNCPRTAISAWGRTALPTPLRNRVMLITMSASGFQAKMNTVRAVVVASSTGTRRIAMLASMAIAYGLKKVVESASFTKNILRTVRRRARRMFGTSTR